ncbi:C39 family peptidase [Candidatus Uhrbacteria bacterium]|nr:C39 family peptidase [Candidatus Uhrbacteria bacterium]
MRRVKTCFELVIFVVVAFAVLYSQRVAISDWLREGTAPALPEAVSYQPKPEPAESQSPPPPPAPVETESLITPPSATPLQTEAAPSAPLPHAYNLSVPFTPQAPFGEWDAVHKETCEEAALYMVQAFYQGVPEGKIEAQTAENEIQKIIAFENQLFGFFEDTTVVQTATLAEMMYGFEQTEVVENPTIEQIKTAVVAGHPVIIPTAGRLLGNPYYTAPGPIYHMLVVRGYTADGKFITNDAGTKRGEAYLYDFDTVMDAMHDWNGGQDITGGRKVALVVYP